jgi:hypothetical protein
MAVEKRKFSPLIIALFSIVGAGALIGLIFIVKKLANGPDLTLPNDGTVKGTGSGNKPERIEGETGSGNNPERIEVGTGSGNKPEQTKGKSTLESPEIPDSVLEKFIFPAADETTRQILEGRPLLPAIDEDTRKNYFLDSPELFKKRVMQAVWENVQALIFESGVSKEPQNNLILNYIYLFTIFSIIRKEDQTGLSDLLSTADLVNYYNENVGKVKGLIKPGKFLSSEEASSTSQEVYLFRVPLIIIRNLVRDKSILNDLESLSDSDSLRVFENVWFVTIALLDNIHDDDEFMFKLVLNRINRFMDQPELRDACPADIRDFCAIKNLEDVKQYHSSKKLPNINKARPFEPFVAIKNCYWILKEGGLSEEEDVQIKEKLNSKIKPFLDYYYGSIRIFSEEIYEILEEDFNENFS